MVVKIMKLYKISFICFILVFCFSLLGCEEEKEKITPQEIVDAFKENEKQHKKTPSNIEDLPDMIEF